MEGYSKLRRMVQETHLLVTLYGLMEQVNNMHSFQSKGKSRTHQRTPATVQSCHTKSGTLKNPNF